MLKSIFFAKICRLFSLNSRNFSLNSIFRSHLGTQGGGKTLKKQACSKHCRYSSRVHNKFYIDFPINKSIFFIEAFTASLHESFYPFVYSHHIVFSRAFFHYSGPFKLDQNPGDKSLSACNVQHPGRRFLRLCDARTA